MYKSGPKCDICEEKAAVWVLNGANIKHVGKKRRPMRACQDCVIETDDDVVIGSGRREVVAALPW